MQVFAYTEKLDVIGSDPVVKRELSTLVLIFAPKYSDKLAPLSQYISIAPLNADLLHLLDVDFNFVKFSFMSARLVIILLGAYLC